MVTGLALTALLMGLAGSPHCVAMCGAATAGIGCTPARLWQFQAARLLGYALLGLAVASSASLLQWGAQQTALLKPFWAMFHLAVLLLGASLLWLGRQPRWLDRASHGLWQRLRGRTAGNDGLQGAPWVGLLWALLPCGLLYSALMVAALAAPPWGGAVVMVAFALGTGTGLQLVPTVWRRLRPQAVRNSSPWGVRLAGTALAMASGWALMQGLWQHTGTAFCL